MIDIFQQFVANLYQYLYHPCCNILLHKLKRSISRSPHNIDMKAVSKDNNCARQKKCIDNQKVL